MHILPILVYRRNVNILMDKFISVMIVMDVKAVSRPTPLVDNSRLLGKSNVPAPLSQKLPVHTITPVVPIKPAVLKLDKKPIAPVAAPVAPKPTIRAAPRPMAPRPVVRVAPKPIAPIPRGGVQSRPAPTVQSSAVIAASRAAGLQKLLATARPKPPTRAVFKTDPAVYSMTPEAKARIQSRITAFGHKNTPSTHRMFRDRKPQAFPRLWKTEKIFYPGDNGRERRPIPGFA